MDRLKQLILTILLACPAVQLCGQTISIHESIVLQSNANAFVSGETMYYKLYCLDAEKKNLSSLSKIAYVALVDSKKNTIFTQKLFLENGIGQGDFFISTKIETGLYKLIGYTNWMLNENAAHFFSTDIAIVNPFQGQSNSTSFIYEESAAAAVTAHQKNPENKLALELNQKEFGTRQPVTLKIKPLSAAYANGNYAVSVRKINDICVLKPSNQKTYDPKKISLQTNSIDFLPELRGEIICGKIIAKNNAPIENISVAFSIPGKNYTFKITKTNTKGEFNFNLDQPNTSANIIIQVIDSNKENYKIEVNEPKKINLDLLTFDAKISLSPQSKKNIEELSVATQIQNAYYIFKKDSIINNEKSQRFFEPIAKDFFLDKYTRFPTLKETVVEIIDGLYFENKNNNYTLHLKDYDLNNELTNPALVLVDGLIIQNCNELFQYKTENIHQISLVKGGYYYGSKLFNGLVAFTTKNFEYESPLTGDFIIKPTLLRPQPKKNYYVPEYSNKSKLERIPDYRYQLFWSPSINLENNEKVFSFYTSDITGTFEVICSGFSENGIPISVKEIIVVK